MSAVRGLRLTVFACVMGLWSLILLIRDALRLRHLPRLIAAPLPEQPPSVAVIVPARNEERNIATVVQGVFDQAYPHFSLTVVNDHSTDQTGAILAQFQHDSRLSVINGADLPAGWMGKCWACWQAANATSSDWLLFLDADTKPQPELLQRTIAHAMQHEVDLLTVLPFVELGSFWEKTIMPAFFSMIQAAYPIEKVNRPHSDVVLANGQFLLIRRAAYDRAGGHATVFDRVLEDVELAQAIVRSGGRMNAVAAQDEIAVRMYTNGAEVREGLTKNAIAGLRNGGNRSVWAGFRQVIVALVPPSLIVGALWANLRRWNHLSRWLINGIMLIVNGFAAWSWGNFMHTLYRLPRRTGLLFPLGLICYMLIAADAARRILTGQGVMWKGRTYTESQKSKIKNQNEKER